MNGWMAYTTDEHGSHGYRGAGGVWSFFGGVGVSEVWGFGGLGLGGFRGFGLRLSGNPIAVGLPRSWRLKCNAAAVVGGMPVPSFRASIQIPGEGKQGGKAGER